MLCVMERTRVPWMSLLFSLAALVCLTDEMVVLSVSVLRQDSMSLLEGMGLNTELE